MAVRFRQCPKARNRKGGRRHEGSELQSKERAAHTVTVQHCQCSNRGAAAARGVLRQLAHRGEISQRNRAGGQTQAPLPAAPSSANKYLSGRFLSRPPLEPRDLRGGHGPIGRGKVGARSQQVRGRRSPASRPLPGGTGARSGAAPGVSHRLAARAPGAPPQRRHVGTGGRAVREHAAAGAGPAVPGDRGSLPGDRGSFPVVAARGAPTARASGSHGNGSAVMSPQRPAVN